MTLQHNWTRRLLALTSLLLICAMLFTSCNMGGGQPLETSDLTETSKPTEDSKSTDNNQTETHVHEWSEWRVTLEPTCTAVGEQSRSCACGENETKAIDAKEHSYVSVVTDPTCTEKGYTTHTCECGDSYTDTYVSASGHEYASVTTAPSCTERGYTTYTCACGDSYIDNYVSATGHSFGEWKTVKEATCTNNGLEIRNCEDCDYFEEKDITALGHDEIKHDAKAT